MTPGPASQRRFSGATAALIVGGAFVLAIVVLIAAVALLGTTQHPSSAALGADQAVAAPSTTGAPSTSVAPTTTTLPQGVVITAGVDSIESSPFKPLYTISGTGSQTSPPFTLPTTRISGGAENDGWVKIWIVPAGHPHGCGQALLRERRR
jgi:hypothetical protein